MLDTVLWAAGLIVLAGAVAYALHTRATGQRAAYAKPDDHAENADTSVARLEAELEDLIREVKCKVNREWKRDNAGDG